jgi:hypothetical protein
MSVKTHEDPPASAVRERFELEALIDEIIEGTFPASDPPAWGSAAARLEPMKDEN